MIFIKYAIQTFGCKVNQYESAGISAEMERHGYERSDNLNDADVVVINSCSVTENSDKKAISLIKRIKSKNPLCIVALAGCFSQAFPERAKQLPADIICGTFSKSEIADKVDSFVKAGERLVEIPPCKECRVYENEQLSDMHKTRAFIKIEDGCDRFCSYCIIPYARGPVRSRLIEDIVKETRFQVEHSHKEMVLVGINLSRYGADIGLGLADAVEAVCSVEGVQRVRLSSLEPELISVSDIERMAAQEKLCPHFHLSLQSGCEATLKRMNRHYTPDEYFDIVTQLRRCFPYCAITTDVMVGFAGETDEEFEQSCEFVKKVGFSGVHVFTYSVREGTAASRRTDFVPADIAAKRYAVMNKIAAELKYDFFSASVGKTEKVLIQRRESENYANGLTTTYIPVRIYGSDAQKQDILTVRIIGAEGGDYCIAEEISRE